MVRLMPRRSAMCFFERCSRSCRRRTSAQSCTVYTRFLLGPQGSCDRGCIECRSRATRCPVFERRNVHSIQAASTEFGYQVGRIPACTPAALSHNSTKKRQALSPGHLAQLGRHCHSRRALRVAQPSFNRARVSIAPPVDEPIPRDSRSQVFQWCVERVAYERPTSRNLRSTAFAVRSIRLLAAARCRPT